MLTARIPLGEARISAEMASTYPPGIPVIVPGQMMTEPIARYLQEGKRLGMLIADPADKTLRTLRLVRK